MFKSSCGGKSWKVGIVLMCPDSWGDEATVEAAKAPKAKAKRAAPEGAASVAKMPKALRLLCEGVRTRWFETI